MRQRVGNLLQHPISVVTTCCVDEVYAHGGALLVSVDKNGYVWVNSNLGAGSAEDSVGAFPMGEGRRALSLKLEEEFKFALSTRTFIPPRVRGKGKKQLAASDGAAA